MKGGYIKCSKKECFANFCGAYCKILNAPIIGKPCPFFKTLEQYANDRDESISRLWESGNGKLLEKYDQAESDIAQTIIGYI